MSKTGHHLLEEEGSVEGCGESSHNQRLIYPLLAALAGQALKTAGLLVPYMILVIWNQQKPEFLACKLA